MPSEKVNRAQSHQAPVDVTERAHTMPRDACLCYPNPKPSGSDPAPYVGIMRDSDGALFWVGIWVRQVKMRKVIEVRRTPKKENSAEPKTE